MDGEEAQRLRRMLETLELEVPVEIPRWTSSPFESLVATIISQNTSWVNVGKAVERLRASIGVTPWNLSRVSTRKIASCIRPAGLYNVKAPRIRRIAQLVCERYGGDLSRVTVKPFEEARRELMGMEGVGRKTADVVLSFMASRPVIAIDTHIERVSKRWRIVDQKAGYEETRAALESVVPPAKRLETHLRLIEFGATVCKARNPQCGSCPVAELCPSRRT